MQPCLPRCPSRFVRYWFEEKISISGLPTNRGLGGRELVTQIQSIRANVLRQQSRAFHSRLELSWSTSAIIVLRSS